MTIRWFAFVVLMTLPLASCVTGNDTGGIIPYASVPPETARQMAIDHCARWNKRARATAVDAREGGYYSFSCRFDPNRPY